MKTLVLSDVHLDAGKKGQGRMGDFVAFLRGIAPEEVSRVVLLGDLFDFWFEYKHVIFSGYFDILRALAYLREQGVAFHFVCGNHDFWAGRFLEKELGFSIYRERALLDFGGQRVLLVHGDGMNRRDWGYRLYKRIARARPVVWLFGLLHPDWAMTIAQWVSRGSRRMFTHADLSKGSEVAPLEQFARTTLASGEADVVMCGHSHHPVVKEFLTPTGTGLYINTGDWLYHRSYVEWNVVKLYRSISLLPRRPVPGRNSSLVRADCQDPENRGQSLSGGSCAQEHNRCD